MTDRHQFRAKWHDYNSGVYFVTICTHEKRHTFGQIVHAQFIASDLGKIVEDNIKSIPQHYQDVEILNYVVMPNHIHLVISVGTRFFALTRTDAILRVPHNRFASDSIKSNMGCLKPPQHADAVADFHHNSRLATIIGAFKAGVSRIARTQCIDRTRRIASLRQPHQQPHPIWQSRFHENIIRNQQSFNNIMNYIDTNVQNWGKDCFAN